MGAGAGTNGGSPVWPGNPFRHPAWLTAHVEVLEAGATVERWGDDPSDQAVTIHHDGGPLRLAGDHLSDRLDPPCDALRRAVEASAAQGRGARLRRLPLPTAQALRAVLPPGSAQVTDRADSPTIQLAGTPWDEYLARPDARRSRRIAAQAERLLDEDDVEVIVADDASSIGPALEVLVALHHLRFGDRSRSFERPEHATVATAAPAMAADGALSIRTLVIDDRPVAALLLFAGAGASWFHQSGWDPAFAERSVGRTLLAEAIRASCRAGLDFHLLCGDHEYKRWWATDDQPVATVEVDPW